MRFTAGASDGMTMTRGMSSTWPASAIACAWLPDEKVTTPRRRCVGREARQRVVGAAELEGAGALQVLALEEQLRAGARVDRARGGDRRAVRDAGNLSRGALDVGEGRQGRVRVCGHRVWVR